ncbi:DUF3653 domain-containing protein [Lysobacter sp. FW306-1B-D06B]|uniref:DUF3653 domain-containing protein n=1 Tax=Lysobacter sp. FW306-1B-D06B TaxID=3140250 RepID=UPI0031400401
MHRPPCWIEGQPCPNECAAADYQRRVLNQLELTGPWQGWRLAGRDLVSPDGQRISPERLRGLIFRQSMDERRERARARRQPKNQLVRVVLVDLAQYRLNGSDAA